MDKPALLREALVKANAWLREDPDRLRMFVQKGSVAATASESRSFAYRFRVSIVLLDYTGHVDDIVLPLLFWLRDQQPDLFADPARARDAISYEVDVIDAQTVDLSLEVELTEMVAVTARDDGNWNVCHVPEPQWGANAYEPPAPGRLKIFTWGDEVLIDATDG